MNAEEEYEHLCKQIGHDFLAFIVKMRLMRHDSVSGHLVYCQPIEEHHRSGSMIVQDFAQFATGFEDWRVARERLWKQADVLSPFFVEAMSDVVRLARA